MENAEEVLQSLDEFAKLKPKDIPRELEEYLCYVAKTGDPVYQWSIVKCLFREKLYNVITEFYEGNPSIDLPPCPNVDPFNYETMKSSLLERLDSFPSAPFTVQRLCELLISPRKEYSRADKFMRAIEKNILVVSTREPGNVRRTDNSGQPELLMNGVMDGRGIELGEAIETVSSDGVNLMHADENEVNVTENENVPVECSSLEDVDMEEQSENSNACNSNTWEKENTDVSHQNEDEDKAFSSSEEVSSKNEASEENVDRKIENSAEGQSPTESAAESSPISSDVINESCKEPASKNEAKGAEVADVNSTLEQEVESPSCKESSGKTDEKVSNTNTGKVPLVEETTPEKIVPQQESSIVKIDGKNSEVCVPDSSCSSAYDESQVSNTAEIENKSIEPQLENAESGDTKEEATAETSVTSPSVKDIVEELVVEEGKTNMPPSTSITENVTLKKEVTEPKEHVAATCSSTEIHEAELPKPVDSKSEENELTEDLETIKGTAPVGEPHTECEGPEEAMEVEINAVPQAAEVQGCDEPMDQTEQPNEPSQEEGKS